MLIRAGAEVDLHMAPDGQEYVVIVSDNIPDEAGRVLSQSDSYLRELAMISVHEANQAGLLDRPVSDFILKFDCSPGAPMFEVIND